MNDAQDREIAPQNAPSPPSQPRKKGRRLRSAPNVRALVASVLREVEASTTIDPAVRARLLLYGSQILASVIATCAYQKEWRHVEEQMRDLKKEFDSRKASSNAAAERGRY